MTPPLKSKAVHNLYKIIFLGLLIIFTGKSNLAADASGFYSVTGPCNLQFPKDQGMHPGYQIEWWYYTGNLKSQNDRRFGFQLTFFRYQLHPPGKQPPWPAKPSAWRSNQLYIAHAALSDLYGGRYMHAEESGREALGIAGAEQNDGITNIFLKKWSAQLGSDQHYLKVETDDFAFDLMVKPMKPPVLHGDAGYSLKGQLPEQSSCYYSFTRLDTSGTVSVNGNVFKVNGLSWMDQEFSSEPLDKAAEGWDWFSLQFDDGTELMIYKIRMKNGQANPASSATFVDLTGEKKHYLLKDYQVVVLNTWKSPHTDAVYPSQWQVKIAPLNMDLLITPNLADQEMHSAESMGLTYWEGSVSITGKKHGKPLSGSGYVELTGYREPFSPSEWRAAD